MAGKPQDYTDKLIILYKSIKNIKDRRLYTIQELAKISGINNHMIKKMLIRIFDKYPNLMYAERSLGILIFDVSGLINISEYDINNVITLKWQRNIYIVVQLYRYYEIKNLSKGEKQWKQKLKKYSGQSWHLCLL